MEIYFKFFHQFNFFSNILLIYNKMSFLERVPLGANGLQFYFDGYRLIDSLVTFFSNNEEIGDAKINI